MYYHGAIPVDYYYLVNRVLLLKEVMVRSVVDKFLFKVWKSPQKIKAAKNLRRLFMFQVPGIKLVLEVFHCTPGTVDSLAEQLKAGQILVRNVQLQVLSDLNRTMFRVFPLVVCMKLNSETTTTKYYGR